MKKVFKFTFSILFVFVLSIALVACGQAETNNQNQAKQKPAETVALHSATLGEVEFENADTVQLNQDGSTISINGTIDAMSASQVAAFGDENVKHSVVLKYTFNKEKTISSFEIKGNVTKVFATDNTAENYVGSISDLLDSEDNEDAYCYLILSAETKSYTLTAKYSDNTTSVITVKINATLATATAE